MKRNSLFAATSLAVALGAFPALAQTTRPAPSTATPSTASPSTAAPTAANTTADWVAQPGAEWRISKLNGLNVYNRANQDLGSIDDILIDRQGQAHAVVIGVGGFLGIGNRLVAVPFDRLLFVFRNNSGQYVDAAGTPVVINEPSTAPGNPTTTTRTDGSVGAAVENAGRAVGQAAVVIGNAVGNSVSNAVGSANSLAPDRAILDATKDQLMNAPQFRYGSGG